LPRIGWVAKIAQKKVLSFPRFFPTFEVNGTLWCWGRTGFAPFITGKNNKQQTTSEEQMKFNQWTLGLAAVGAVSMASAVRADEAKLSPVQTALANTTISGYVSVSANASLDPNGAQYASSPAGYIPLQSGKQDQISLDVIKLSIAKPQDESPWASGYQVDLLFGPDAVGWNNSPGAGNSDIAIQQAYISLRTPVGNGIDWKLGVFNTVIGYESFDAGSNPNYTRSWGWDVEPTQHTGVLATYKINDEFTVSAGIADTLSAGINARVNRSNAYDSWNKLAKKTFLGSVAFTAPSSWGWAAGSTIYAGTVYGFTSGSSFPVPANSRAFAAQNQWNLYAGATVNTPCKALTVGVAFDYVQNLGGGSSYQYVDGGTYSGSYHTDVSVLGLYATYKVTDKLSLNARGEWIHGTVIGAYRYVGDYSYSGSQENSADAYELTGTVEYDMWANVISRLEVRWDHVSTPDTLAQRSGLGLYANVIYKF
jgi:hypothetical protein